MQTDQIYRGPEVEDLARRLIDGSGFHGVEAIPAKDVYAMLISIAIYEHKWNQNLSKMLFEAKMIESRASMVVRSDEFFGDHLTE